MLEFCPTISCNKFVLGSKVPVHWIDVPVADLNTGEKVFKTHGKMKHIFFLFIFSSHSKIQKILSFGDIIIK